MNILGIDTSNYTTSVALLNTEDGSVRQAKRLLPVKAGQAGLRQSDAVFHHVKQLPEMMAQLAPESVETIGVSARPRNQEGSYMPCFLTGLGTAHTLGDVLHVDVFETSHQIGHVLAALYSAKKLSMVQQEEFLAFHVSGGTTDVLLCRPDSENLLDISMIGTSLDLKAGQAIDRVGLLLGLQFPCGIALEQLAIEWTEPIKCRPTIKGLDCCLSGIENQCQQMLQKNEPRAKIARYCLEMVGATILKMTEAARKEYGNLPVIYAGGVMSDKLIRPNLETAGNCWFSEPVFSCDNATGVAIYAAWKAGVWGWQ